MPGMYKFERDKHHDMIVKGQKCTSADITSCRGKSRITSRPSTDPEYESELLQESRCTYDTRTLGKFKQDQERVFRIQNGEWSYWSTNGNGKATEKIADLVLVSDFSALVFRAKQPGLVDRNGVNKHLGFTFYERDTRHWAMHHKIQWPGGHETVQANNYYKLASESNGRLDGWDGWRKE